MVQWLACLGTNPLAIIQTLAQVDSVQLTQLFILPFVLDSKWVPEGGKLLLPSCHTGPVSWVEGFLTTTGSKVNAIKMNTEDIYSCSVMYALNFTMTLT